MAGLAQARDVAELRVRQAPRLRLPVHHRDERLLAAGNVLGKGYTAGVGMSIGTAFGRIAGTNAALASKGIPAQAGRAQSAINQGANRAVA